tara:strand:- start:23778 stop:24113 length:336 start_codon:yes stop_codon:yes gene_type:complete
MKKNLVKKISGIATAGLFALNLSYGNAFAQDVDRRTVDSYVHDFYIATLGVMAGGLIANELVGRHPLYITSEDHANLEEDNITDCDEKVKNLIHSGMIDSSRYSFNCIIPK